MTYASCSRYCRDVGAAHCCAALSVTFSSAILWESSLLGVIYATTRILQGWCYMPHTFWAQIFVWLACLLTALWRFVGTRGGRCS